MPKKTTTESGKEPTGKEIRLPADSTIKSFNSSYTDMLESTDAAKLTLKDASDIAKKKHLDMWAFKLVKGLYDRYCDGDPKKAETLAKKLSQFDKIRAYFELDHHANLQGRLFGEGEIGSGPKASEAPPREPDEDGEPDLRPSHLRQPGASAASVVQDLAAKTGAKTSGEADPITKVGRGAPKLN